MKTQPPQFIAGFPIEWEDFEQRNRLFLERYSHLSEAFNIAFNRILAKSEPIEKFVFGYGQLCREDFLEVFLLSANGYGIGATKLLRIRETEVEERFVSVKKRFMTTDCKKCGTEKLHHNWNKLDFVTMAKKSGPLGDLILHGYFGPLTQAHSHPATLTSRLTLLESGGINFVSGPQRNMADVALLTAHEIVLCVLDVQKKQFDIPDLPERLQVCHTDLEEIRNEPRKKVL
jgi:hypothetical protein